ncbi:MAG: glycosyltransferase family 2 protein [Muribaculaceae bacterium]|nr:glycosyltransferase family 2 protein [Muribaculaceae bacterium]
MAKLSIIMPTYNVGEYIGKAIESVFNQSYKDWELLIVDDGSTDNSIAECIEFAKKDNRIKILHKSNGGLSDARNFGLTHASGQYIHFFDPDDYLKGEFYSELLKKIESEKADIVISGYKVEYQYNTYDERKLITRNCIVDSNSKFTYSKSSSPLEFVCYAFNKIFLKDFLIKQKLEYEKGLSRIEDAEFMSRVIQHNPKIAYLEKGTYVYVQRGFETLNKGFDDYIISLALRRIYIDIKLINYFMDLPDDFKFSLEDRIKSGKMVACINRLFSSQYGKESIRRNYYLKEIKKLLKPTHFYPCRKGVKSVFDLLTYYGLKYNLFSLITFIQRCR